MAKTKLQMTDSNYIEQNASVTSAADKIVLANGSGIIDDSFLALTTAGDIVYSDGTDLQRKAIGTARQRLEVNSSEDGFEYKTKGIIFTDFSTSLPFSSGEVTVITNSIPANILSEYSGLRISGDFAPTNSSGSSKNYTLRIKYGGSTLGTISGISTSSFTGSARISFECIILYVGASSQSSFFSAYGFVGSTNNDYVYGGGTTASVDSTASQNLTITAQSSVGDLEGSMPTLLVEVI